MKKQKLKMLKVKEYAGVHQDDPIKFYNFPFLGAIYRRRVEKCLAELSGGDKVLEIGFGSGVTFLNLSEMYNEIHGLDLASDTEAVAAAFKKLGVRTFLKNGDVISLPYPNNYFDSVLLISILEHLKPGTLVSAFREIHRVLKNKGQVVYGVPVEKKIMDYVFRLLGYKIENFHFSNRKQIAEAVKRFFRKVSISEMCLGPFGQIYEVGHFIKEAD